MPESLDITEPTKIYTDAGAAKALGINRQNVARKRKTHSLGRKLGSTPILTKEEVEMMRRLTKPVGKPPKKKE